MTANDSGYQEYLDGKIQCERMYSTVAFGPSFYVFTHDSVDKKLLTCTSMRGNHIKIVTYWLHTDYCKGVKCPTVSLFFLCGHFGLSLHNLSQIDREQHRIQHI